MHRMTRCILLACLAASGTAAAQDMRAALALLGVTEESEVQP